MRHGILIREKGETDKPEVLLRVADENGKPVYVWLDARQTEEWRERKATAEATTVLAGSAETQQGINRGEMEQTAAAMVERVLPGELGTTVIDLLLSTEHLSADLVEGRLDQLTSAIEKVMRLIPKTPTEAKLVLQAVRLQRELEEFKQSIAPLDSFRN